MNRSDVYEETARMISAIFFRGIADDTTELIYQKVPLAKLKYGIGEGRFVFKKGSK